MRLMKRRRNLTMTGPNQYDRTSSRRLERAAKFNVLLDGWDPPGARKSASFAASHNHSTSQGRSRMNKARQKISEIGARSTSSALGCRYVPEELHELEYSKQLQHP